MKIIKSVIFISGSGKDMNEFGAKYRDKVDYYWFWNNSRDIFDYLIYEEIPAIKMAIMLDEFWIKLKLIWADKVLKISGHINDIQSILEKLKLTQL